MSEQLQPQTPAEALELEKKPVTAGLEQQSRTEAVGELLNKAYANASTLQLTPNESKALREPFHDSAIRGGAKGDARILYISHIHLSDRLNDVLGIGQWAIIKRTQRLEQTKTADGKPLHRIYYEGVLLIRGTFVAEAIGVGQYHPNNPKEDYGTGLESSMSDCLTRCCKRLGIGSQTWDKSFCDEWLKKYGGSRPAAPLPRSTAEPLKPTKPAPAEGEDNIPMGDEPKTDAAPGEPPLKPADLPEGYQTVEAMILNIRDRKGKGPFKMETGGEGVFDIWDKTLAQTAKDFLDSKEKVTIFFVAVPNGEFTNKKLLKIERI